MMTLKNANHALKPKEYPRGYPNKLVNDITFYDTDTMKARCTFNGCIKKFKAELIEIRVPWRVMGESTVGRFQVVMIGQTHKCQECGQTCTTTKDTKINKQIYFDIKTTTFWGVGSSSPYYLGIEENGNWVDTYQYLPTPKYKKKRK